MRPKSFTIFATVSLTLLDSVTSIRYPFASPPISLILFKVFSIDVSLISQTAIFAPFFAKVKAVSPPIYPPAPVISATLFENYIINSPV